MGIEFASTAPLNRPALRTLDQSCAGIHTPYRHTYRANEMNACNELGYFLLRLYDSSGKSSSASSTTSTTSSGTGTSISVVVMLPSGTGIYFTFLTLYLLPCHLTVGLGSSVFSTKIPASIRTLTILS